MPQAPFSHSRQTCAFSLFGVYITSLTLPGAILFCAASFSTFPLDAVAQTPPRPSSSDAPPSAPTTPRDLLEQARQRLINQGRVSSPTDLPTGDLHTPTSSNSETNTNTDFDTYRLGPGDSLFVNVLRFPDLSFQPTLDLQGNVLVPLVGSLSLKGLTLEETRQLIQTELNRFVVNPQVDITLTAQRPVQVTISGEVVQPGVYPLSAPQLNVALLSAGGTTRLADLRTIRIRRTLENGSVLERDVDLFTPLQDSTSLPNIRLVDGDSVIVPALNPETAASYDRTLVARSTLTQRQIVIRVLNYAAGSGERGSTGGAVSRFLLPNGSDFLDALTNIAPNPDRANLRNVALIRFDPVQGRVVTQELDGKDALLGNASQNLPLENNDVIVIGRNLISRISAALNSLTQPFRDILGFLLFFDSLGDSANNLFRPGSNND